MASIQSDKKATQSRSFYEVSWWDEVEGIGIASDASGQEYILHRSNLTSNQEKTLCKGVLVTAIRQQIAGEVNILINLKLATESQSKANQTMKQKSVVRAA